MTQVNLWDEERTFSIDVLVVGDAARTCDGVADEPLRAHAKVTPVATSDGTANSSINEHIERIVCQAPSKSD